MKNTHRHRLTTLSILSPARWLAALLLALPLVGCGAEKAPEPPAYDGPSHPPGRKPPREVPPQGEPDPNTPPPAAPSSGGG